MTTTTVPAQSRKLPWGSNILRKLAGDPYQSDAADVVQGNSARQSLETAGLNWDVSMQPMTTTLLGPDGVTLLEVPERSAVVGDHGKVVGVVGTGYETMNNFEQAEFTDLLVDTSEASVVGSGATNDGGFGCKVYSVVKLDGDLTPKGLPDEATESFFMSTNAFDGSQSYHASLFVYRMACVNGLRYPIKGASMSWAIRHTSSMKTKLVEVRKALQNAAGYTEAFYADMEQLLTIPVSTDVGMQLVDDLIPVPDPKVDDDGKVTNQRTINMRENARLQLGGNWLDSVNLEDVRHTGWGFVNAYAEWNQWGKSYRLDPIERLAKQVITGADRELARVHNRVLELV